MKVMRALIVLAVVLMAVSAVDVLVIGFGRNAFVGNISMTFGGTTYAISVVAVAIAVVVFIAVIAVTATRRFAK